MAFWYRGNLWRTFWRAHSLDDFCVNIDSDHQKYVFPSLVGLYGMVEVALA